jgi:hypothetical protein
MTRRYIEKHWAFIGGRWGWLTRVAKMMTTALFSPPTTDVHSVNLTTRKCAVHHCRLENKALYKLS